MQDDVTAHSSHNLPTGLHHDQSSLWTSEQNPGKRRPDTDLFHKNFTLPNPKLNLPPIQFSPLLINPPLYQHNGMFSN
jgi:hypothetical protein